MIPSLDSGAAMKVAERFGLPLNANTLNYANAVIKRWHELNPVEETPVEMWHGERKIVIYKDTVLRVWGPHIELDMQEFPRTLQSVQEASEWLYSDPEPEVCGNCNGSGWMVRDPDIGTDQECFVCDGSGRYEEYDR